jgi:hypothetical protein
MLIATVCALPSVRFLIYVIDSIWNHAQVGFVKHELKGVLKCIGVEIWTHSPGALPQTVTDTLRIHHRP